MTNIEKYSWLPILMFIIGAGLPSLIHEYPEESFDSKIFGGILSSMAMFTYAAFKKLSVKYRRFRNWAGNTLHGACITAFTSGFALLMSATVFAALPVPNWLHFSIAIAVALYAFYLLALESIDSNER